MSTLSFCLHWAKLVGPTFCLDFMSPHWSLHLGWLSANTEPSTGFKVKFLPPLSSPLGLTFCFHWDQLRIQLSAYTLPNSVADFLSTLNPPLMSTVSILSDLLLKLNSPLPAAFVPPLSQLSVYTESTSVVDFIPSLNLSLFLKYLLTDELQAELWLK